MKHIDLFSGIGGFSLAVDRVWHEQKNEHIFVEWDDFCTEVLKKHWPEAEYHRDIKIFVADTERERPHISKNKQKLESKRSNKFRIIERRPFLLTGGFPCQPFSQAGRRKGTGDDRYLWPPMLDAISLFRPEWVIAENVAGLVTWDNGVVLETVCSDLEKEGYEVQPFIIPAVAVGAPHRRDRVWIVAHAISSDARGNTDFDESSLSSKRIQKRDEMEQSSESNSTRVSSNSKLSRLQGSRKEMERQYGFSDRERSYERTDWKENWTEVATSLCGVDDGIPRRLDRNPRLKALGNAIVPQVAEEILKGIKKIT